MERLTEKHFGNEGYYMKCSEDCHAPQDCIDCAAFEKLVDRLAAYEDTGLEPEEVKDMAVRESNPVRSGRWGYGKTKKEIVCSVCGSPRPFVKQKPLMIKGKKLGGGYHLAYKSNYCPNCGARMDGE